jgi:hypothetical protein
MIRQMASPWGTSLAPIVVNFYMENFEHMELNTAPQKPSHRDRYIYNTFVNWPLGIEIQKFQLNSSSIHANIKITMNSWGE